MHVHWCGQNLLNAWTTTFNDPLCNIVLLLHQQFFNLLRLWMWGHGLLNEYGQNLNWGNRVINCCESLITLSYNVPCVDILECGQKHNMANGTVFLFPLLTKCSGYCASGACAYCCDMVNKCDHHTQITNRQIWIKFDTTYISFPNLMQSTMSDLIITFIQSI